VYTITLYAEYDGIIIIYCYYRSKRVLSLAVYTAPEQSIMRSARWGQPAAAAAAAAAAGRHDSREPHAASKHKITPNDVPLWPRWI